MQRTPARMCDEPSGRDWSCPYQRLQTMDSHCYGLYSRHDINSYLGDGKRAVVYTSMIEIDSGVCRILSLSVGNLEFGNLPRMESRVCWFPPVWIPMSQPSANHYKGTFDFLSQKERLTRGRNETARTSHLDTRQQL